MNYAGALIAVWFTPIKIAKCESVFPSTGADVLQLENRTDNKREPYGYHANSGRMVAVN